MDFNRRFTGGISWKEEFGRQVGRAINALEEDTSPSSSADYLVTYDASTNLPKKILYDNIKSSLPTFSGMVIRPKFERASTTTLTIGAGVYHHNGTSEQTLSWDSSLTFTAGSGGSNSDSTNLGASQQHYLYIDDSAVVTLGATTLTAAEFLNSTTAPSWSAAKHGWYNGSDRCICGFRTDGSNQIEVFWHGGGDFVAYDDYETDLAETDIDLTWTSVSLTIPAFCTSALISSQMTTDDAKFSWRTTGSASSTGHILGDRRQNFAITQVITDSSQTIEVVSDLSNTAQLILYTDGWYFPEGM